MPRLGRARPNNRFRPKARALVVPPIVNAGIDSAVTNRSAFNRTATESGSPTSRAWTILAGPTDATTGPNPTDVLNIGTSKANHFLLQYAPDGGGASITKTQAEILAGFSVDPNFVVTDSNSWVQFQVRADGAPLGGSSTPRSELRQVNVDGSNAAFDALTGDYYFRSRVRIPHLPASDPEVVVMQLHDGTSDKISIRTQLISGQTKLLCRINGTAVTPRFSESYVPDTPFDLLVKISNGGAVEVFFDTVAAPVTGQLVSTGSASWYFKAGSYAQFDATSAGSGTEYAAVKHQAFRLVMPGDPGQGTVLSTSDTLSWTPTVPGIYVLRYSATNSAGTGYDDVVVNVSPLTIALAGGTTTATSSVVGSPKLRVATSTLTTDPVANTSASAVKLTRATKTVTDDPVATSSASAVKLTRATKTVTNDPVAASAASLLLHRAARNLVDDAAIVTSATGNLAIRRRTVMSGAASATATATASAVRIKLFDADVAIIDTYGTGFLRIPGSGYFKLDAYATGTLRVVKTVHGHANSTSSASVVAARRAATFHNARSTANATATGRGIGVRRNDPVDAVANGSASATRIIATVPLYAENAHIDATADPAYLLNIQSMQSHASATGNTVAGRFLVVTHLAKTTTAAASGFLSLYRATRISKTVTAISSLTTATGLHRTRLFDVATTTVLSSIAPVSADRTVVMHPQVQIKTTVAVADLVRVTKFFGYRLLAESDIRERSVKIVLTTANVEGYVNRHNTRDIVVIRGYVTAVAEATANLVWAPKWHRALAKTSLHGNLVALKQFSEEIHAQSAISRGISVVKMMSTIVAIQDEHGNFVPVAHPHAYDLAHEPEQMPVVFDRTFTVLR